MINSRSSNVLLTPTRVRNSAVVQIFLSNIKVYELARLKFISQYQQDYRINQWPVSASICQYMTSGANAVSYDFS